MLDSEELQKDIVKNDEHYVGKNTNLYKVLKKSTAKVTARETVNKCEDTKYGAMAYAYLK